MNNKSNLLSFTDVQKIECPICSSNNNRTLMKEEVVHYSVKGEKSVELPIKIPVRECIDCSFQFTDVEAEDIRHVAVCKHLNRLTPLEIRGLRGKYNLTRKQFSECTLLGEASLARWETGELIQNGGYDQLLYLLSYTENYERLKNRFSNLNVESAKPDEFAKENLQYQFRALENVGELREQSTSFSLVTLKYA